MFTVDFETYNMVELLTHVPAQTWPVFYTNKFILLARITVILAIVQKRQVITVECRFYYASFAIIERLTVIFF